ncbi:TDT family transporter [Alkaliphilus serpentinus]|uniref:TDT family transporter n=1 Tax=Alkaliphilus serpentinus TaxID=1482731 RepID=A0A833HP38_9FIRM|nr:TDT family transporter [Alkaliphilus serpentinus]KAB3530223.1 TDT family transporter [Alkaliphilus serpentinus]
MVKLIKKVPIPMAGLMLALASLGNLVLSYGSGYRNVFGLLSAILLILLVGKVLIDGGAVAEDMKNPAIASVAPTFSMGIMILSTYIKPFNATLAFTAWMIGLILHGLFIIYFTKAFLLRFEMKKVLTSYFVVYVGIVVGSVTAPAYNMQNLGQLIFWFGFISYLILLPVVIYRVLIIKGIPEPLLPTITIFAAPASLCLAGYISTFSVKSNLLITFMMVLAMVMTLSVLLYLPRLLKLKFYPSYSAFTFPLVISGIATKLANGYLVKSGNTIDMLKYIVRFQEALSIAIVLYVLIRYIMFLTSDLKATKAPAAPITK